MTEQAFSGYRPFQAGPDDPLRVKWNAVRFALDVPASISSVSPDKVGILNAKINSLIAYRSEPDGDDVWQTPAQTLSLGRGDCEDFAILKYALLTKAGIPARLVIGEIRKLGMGNLNGNLPHAWCAAFVDGRWFALDNNADRPIPAEEYPNWTPLAALHDDQVLRFGKEFSLNEIIGAPTMPAWRGIVGKSFTPDAFEKYVSTLKFNLWRPRFIVVHNTSAPDLKTWQGWQQRTPPITDERWAQNLVGYYRDQQHWAAGPHLFITPKGILAFSPLTGPGTHSPAWNSITWGVETVGEFEHEPFSGPVRDNLIAALAILHAAAGLQPVPYERGVRGLHFHKEDPVTTHRSCPGKNMVKADLVHAVQIEIERRHRGGGHAHALLAEPEIDSPADDEGQEAETLAIDDQNDPAVSSDPPHGASSIQIEVVKRRLDAMGYHEFGILNGEWGGKTAAAIAAFKNDRHLRGEPVIDAALLAEIDAAQKEGFQRPISEARATATEKDIAPKVLAVQQTLFQRLGAKVMALGSGLAAMFSGASSYFSDIGDKIQPIKEFFTDVPAWVWFALIASAAILVWYSANKATAANVKDFNEGRRL